MDITVLIDDPILIQLVETMGTEINDDYSRLQIKEFPMKYKSRF